MEAQLDHAIALLTSALSGHDERATLDLRDTLAIADQLRDEVGDDALLASLLGLSYVLLSNLRSELADDVPLETFWERWVLTLRGHR